MTTTSQKHAELKKLGKQARETIYDMLRLTTEILADHEYVDQFGGEVGLRDLLEAEEYVHFGGDPSLTAMLRAYRANPDEATWKEYRYNIRAMIELANEQEDRGRREARQADREVVSQAVADVIADAAKRHPGSVTKATDAAEAAIRGVKGFRDVLPDLVKHAVKERIYDLRHKENLEQRQSGFEEGSPYNYFLAGTVLGRLRGDQLADLASDEDEAASGHAFNARICRELAKLVPDGKTVRQVVSEGQLQAIMSGENGRKVKLRAAG